MRRQAVLSHLTPFPMAYVIVNTYMVITHDIGDCLPSNLQSLQNAPFVLGLSLNGQNFKEDLIKQYITLLGLLSL